jgi:hypothetical protein
MSTAVAGSTGMDVRILGLPDMPPEWDTVPPEVLRMLEPDERGLYSQQQMHIEEDIVSKRWFIVANTLGWRCKECRSGMMSPNSLPGDIHPYITKGCLPRPFHGLNEILMFWREKGKLSDTTTDSFVMRLGEVIVPITVAQAKDFYQRIEDKIGLDLAWNDYYARYVRRYKEYLRSLGWNPTALSKEQRTAVLHIARQEYIAWKKGGE